MNTQEKFCLIVTLLIVMVACEGQKEAPKSEHEKAVMINPNADQDINMVKDHIKALEKGDYDAAYIKVGNQTTHYGPKYSDQLGNDDHRNFWKGVHETHDKVTFGDPTYLSVKVNEGRNEGTWVLVWSEFSAFNKELEKEYKFPYHTAYLIENGEIKNAFGYYNEMDFLEQLGFEATLKE